MKGVDIILVCLIFIVLIFSFSNCGLTCNMKENFGGLEPATRMMVGGLAGNTSTRFGQFQLQGNDLIIPPGEHIPQIRYKLLENYTSPQSNKKYQIMKSAQQQMNLLPSPEYNGPPSC